MKYINYLIAFLVNACFVMHVCGMQAPKPKKYFSGKKAPSKRLSDIAQRQAMFDPNEKRPDSPRPLSQPGSIKRRPSISEKTSPK